MISNAQRKLFASLSTAKGRRESGLFMAQGAKCVEDTLGHFDLECIIADAELEKYGSNALQAKREDMQKISTLSTAPHVIAIYKIPQYETPKPVLGTLYVALDCVQDPGNLGTIMRVCDWMGVRDIYASRDTVDVWNPKTVLASMGAISRVKVHYVDLPLLLKSAATSGADVIGTFLEGQNIYKATLPKGGIVVMGNEGNGISNDIASCVTSKISIPSYPPGEPTSESLNVAIATAITLSEFRRNG